MSVGIPNRAVVYSPPAEKALRAFKDAAHKAVSEGVAPRELAERLVCAVRGYDLAGPNERDLASVIAAMLADLRYGASGEEEPAELRGVYEEGRHA